MAEVPEGEAIPSSSESTESVIVDPIDDEGPSPKKRKTVIENEPNEKLEHRLGGILCCAVCLDLPQAAVYQVFQNSWQTAICLISCFIFLLIDSHNVITTYTTYFYFRNIYFKFWNWYDMNYSIDIRRLFRLSTP